MDDKKQKSNQLNIELPEEIAEGLYSNLALINHSQAEFIIDFIRMVPNVPKAKVKSRVIITPQHAKRLLRVMAEQVKNYESKFGKIKEPEQQVSFPMNFNTPPKAQA